MTLRFTRSSSVAVTSSLPTLPMRQMNAARAGGSCGCGKSRRYCALNCVLGSRPKRRYSTTMSTSAISGTPTPSRPHSPTLTRAQMRERLASSASLFSSARTRSSMGVVLAGASLRAAAGNRMRPSTKV